MEDISNEVDFVLDNEIKKIEQGIAEKFGAISVPESEGSDIYKVETVAVVEDNTPKEDNVKNIKVIDEILNVSPVVEEVKKTKKDYVDEIIKLQTAMGIQASTESALIRKTKKELINMLAKLLDDGIQKANGIKNTSGMGLDQRNEISVNSIVRAMYEMNIIFAGTLEKATINYQKEIGFPALEGWTEDLENKKENLMEVLREIYMTNREVVDTYIGPVSTYLFIMLTSAGNITLYNMKKKKIN